MWLMQPRMHQYIMYNTGVVIRMYHTKSYLEYIYNVGLIWSKIAAYM